MSEVRLICPTPQVAGDRILLAHGGGGRMTQQLIENLFLPAFANPLLSQRHDGATFRLNGARLAFTTDSFVVRPLLFPGGNIGDLAVNGTVNDLAMCGAKPQYLSAGFILEEGLPMDTLRIVVDSMAAAARQADVQLVTGDTKVVDRGKADGMFITTAGVGAVIGDADIGPAAVQPDDVVIVSGALGAHGIAVLSVREGLEFEGPIVSDTAPLWPAVEALFREGIEVHCLRDLTRGGLASALNEIAAARGLGIQLDEGAIPVDEAVRGACELLGLDPLYVANEGRFAVFVPESQQDRALKTLRGIPIAAQASRIGKAIDLHAGMVSMRTMIGGTRVLDMLSGEQLPRIC